MNFFVSVTDLLVLGLLIAAGLAYLLIILWTSVSRKLRNRRITAQWRGVPQPKTKGKGNVNI
jgi:hypothetical protein